MQRRDLLKLAASAPAILARPHVARADASRVLRFIPQSDVTSLDPVWTSVYVTRNHGYLVFDTLYGQDNMLRTHPQMVERHGVERDGREWRLTLRDGLMFHDGTRVLARDCVASIRRWAQRDAFGQALMQVTDELSAADDRTILFRLQRPFPMLPEALGKIGINMLPIMPERLALTDPFKQVSEMVGSGPFRFAADERVSGARAVYTKFEQYRPRETGVAEGTAGPKRVWFERVEWNVIPDVATAAAAMQRGEADWWEQPSFDLVPLLKRNPALDVSMIEVSGNIGLLRFNELHKPFNDPAIRRALLPALAQADFMQAICGEDRSAWRDGVGFLGTGPQGALASPADVERSRREIAAAGYAGEPVVVLTPSDYPRINALALVAADMLRRCGLTVDLQEMDWGSVIRRRASKASPDAGGWSVFFTTFTGIDMASPASNLGLRGNGAGAWFGWPTAPRLEALRDQWLATPDPAAQSAIAAEIQRQALVDVPFLPLGQFFQPTVRRRELVDGLVNMPLFWNIRRA